MISSKFSGKVLGSSVFLLLVMVIGVFAQDYKPVVVYKKENKPMPVALRNNILCAGYIQTAPINTNFEVVGGNDEREQESYAQGDLLYVSQGSNNGVKVGETFSVVRPRGQFQSKLSNKKGKLGFYVEEVGTVEIIRVKNQISVAKVKFSCDTILLGDLLVPIENRDVPLFQTRPALDIFAEPNGKTVGKIVMGRDAREAFSRDQIVYIDLGVEDNVKIGDYLTVFRPLGKGGAVNLNEDETMSTKDVDYGSDMFQGNPYSNMAPRKDGATAEGERVNSNKAKSRRPAGIRKIVGDMIILNVKEKTATALILRNAQEVHVGDMVEVQ